MIGLECTAYLFTDESLTVYILSYHTACRFHQKHAELCVGVVGIGRIFLCTKIADSHILCVIGIGMTAGRNEFVRRIVGAGQGTVREHIAVEVIAYGVAVERDQTVIRVILEAAVGGRGYVTCCIVVKGLCRNDRVITELLDSPCSKTLLRLPLIDETIPNTYRWTITAAAQGGCLIKNVHTQKYLYASGYLLLI